VLLPTLLLLLVVPAPATAPVDIDAYEGKVVLLDFWASWCGPCAESFPWMNEMLDRHGADGLVVVAVNLDEDPADAERFLQGRDHGFRHVSDPEGKLAEAYGVSVMPSSVLFDREGRPAFFHEGFHAEQTAEYEQHIVALLEGKVEGDPALLGEKAGNKGKLGVRPWQRGLLAREDMRLDCDPLDLAIDDHIYFSKEASSGGRGFGGGGCGCN
jgi:thiol-disulfide isomerase/thioredoxin